MSEEHVAEMNRRLAADESTRRACRELERDYLILYELDHAPDTVYWAMRFDPTHGVCFSLGPQTGVPDVVYHGDYVESIRATAAFKSGSNVGMPWQVSGNSACLELLAPIIEQARQVATLDTRIPHV
jgi:hypothetical protein